MDPVIRSRAGLVLPALPFTVIAAIAICVFRMVIEPGWGLLPLLALGPGGAGGKGLPAVESAAAVLGVFREADNEENSVEAIVPRSEPGLARQLGDEQFVTAILAEVSADGTKIELLSCGHPAPLLLGAARPRFIGLDEGSLPLGLGQLADVPRIPVTIAFEPGDALLFYTDGASEARNKAGVFFPLAGCAAVRAAPDPATLPGRLGDEVVRYVGHAPDDDVALLVVYRDGAVPY